MRKTRVSMALIFSVLVAGAAFAAEPAPAAPASPTVSQVAPADEAPSGELEGLFTPKPDYKYGMKNGPCSVSVTCIGGTQISCSGQTICYWKVDSLPSRGFVECDGRRTACAFTID